MIIKREIKENSLLAGLLSFSLSRGENLHPRRSRISASICLSPSSLQCFCPPFILSPPAFCRIDRTCRSAFRPTNGGSFRFTFILISDYPREIRKLGMRRDFLFSKSHIFVTDIFDLRPVRLWSSSIFAPLGSHDKIKLIKTSLYI